MISQDGNGKTSLEKAEFSHWNEEVRICESICFGPSSNTRQVD